MSTDQNTDTDLHDLTLPDLSEWGPDVPGTPVEVTHPDGTVALSYAWRDGYGNIADPARKCRRSPFPWHALRRITAVLADDPTRWVPVDADERVQLGEHLVGARACSEQYGVTVVGPVVEVDDDGWLWAKEGHLLAAPHYPLRVHPADLARAREKAQPPLPEEPPVGSFALDRNGGEWFCTVDGWVSARSGWCWEWAKLNERSGPITVVHRAEP